MTAGSLLVMTWLAGVPWDALALGLLAIAGVTGFAIAVLGGISLISQKGGDDL